MPIPHILEQLVEGVKETPQEPFPEQTVEQIIDDPIPPFMEGKAGVMLPSHAAAHAAPTLVSEYVALARDVACTTPEISIRTVEQIVDGPEDDEQMLFCYQANIDQCVHMLKTKKEDLEKYEKQTAAILERAPRAASRDRREWQKVVDESNAQILHHHQLVHTTKEKLASLMREMHEKRELHKRMRLGDH